MIIPHAKEFLYLLICGSLFVNRTVVMLSQTFRNNLSITFICLNTLFAALFGLHYKNETDSKGNTTRYAFNAATLKQSTVAWKNSSAGLFVSTDGGKTWGYGWESNDTAVRTAILLEQTLKG